MPAQRDDRPTMAVHGAAGDVDLASYLRRAYRVVEPKDAARADWIIGAGAGAAAAIDAARRGDARRVVLFTPDRVDDAILEAVKQPALVIVGAEDAKGAIVARRFCTAMPSCYLSYVFDCGSETVTARPEAVRALLDEFLDKGEAFPVRTASHIVHP